jgi:hypothetical protein
MFLLLILEQMPVHFEKHYGERRFEMMQVEDMAKAGCLDHAVEGV